MKISKYNAKQIVSEISQIIDSHINIIDDTGVIIASTDEKRINTFHGAAKRLINEKLDELVIRESDIYAGTKKGVNLPIVFEGEIVGVVGITGDYEEVGRFGYVIKKMTEILLMDIYYRERKRHENHMQSQYLEKWIFSKPDQIDYNFMKRGQSFGFDLDQMWKVAVVSLDKTANDNEEHVRRNASFINILKSNLESDGNLFIESGYKYILLLNQKSKDRVEEIIGAIKSEIERTMKARAYFGVYGMAVPANKAGEAFVKANKAWRSCLAKNENEICYYEDLDLDIFIDEITTESKIAFMKKIFQDCTDEEVREWIELLKVFYESEGSVGIASQKMHIHKNTLQYRIKKLIEKTGYDPRQIDQAPLFYMAIKFCDFED